MEEPVSRALYLGEERRRRWPGEHAGEERRGDPFAGFETDQEPDQSPLAGVGASNPGSPAARG